MKLFILLMEMRGGHELLGIFLSCLFLLISFLVPHFMLLVQKRDCITDLEAHSILPLQKYWNGISWRAALNAYLQSCGAPML